MRIRFGRAIAAAFLTEVLGVAALALLVAIFGPGGGFEASRPFAERLGQWVGPISGFFLCIAGGYWTAKAAAPADRPMNGLVMGATAAALDIAFAAMAGAGFAWLLVVSNFGRLAGGWLGGFLAAQHEP